jgi:hypothetical protein
MASNSFNSLLRCCVSAMYTENGVQTLDHIAGYGLSEEAKVILKELITLVMETEYFKPDTRSFLSGKSGIYWKVVYSSGCASNSHTSRSRINYDLSRLRGALGEDALDIIIKQKDADLTRYREKIQALIQKHRQKSLLEGFTIKLPECGELVASISEDEVLTLISLARIHSKKGLKLDEKRITASMVGYIRHLEQHQEHLQGDELEYFQTLTEWLR